MAWVAGVFSLLVGLTMIQGRLSIRAEDPLKSPQFREYKEKLRLSPMDEQIKQRVRQLDLQLRQRYFRQLSQMIPILLIKWNTGQAEPAIGSVSA